MGGDAEALNNALIGLFAPAMVTAFIRRLEDQTWRMGGIHERRGRDDAGLSCYMDGKEWLARLHEQCGMERTQMLHIRRLLVDHRIIFYEPDLLQPGCGRISWNMALDEWIPLKTSNWGGRREGAGYTREKRAARQAPSVNLNEQTQSSLHSSHSSLHSNLSSLHSAQATGPGAVRADAPLTIIDNKNSPMEREKKVVTNVTTPDGDDAIKFTQPDSAPPSAPPDLDPLPSSAAPSPTPAAKSTRKPRDLSPKDQWRVDCLEVVKPHRVPGVLYKHDQEWAGAGKLYDLFPDAPCDVALVAACYALESQRPIYDGKPLSLMALASKLGIYLKNPAAYAANVERARKAVNGGYEVGATPAIATPRPAPAATYGPAPIVRRGATRPGSIPAT
jgi:hypothetical protein